MLIENFSILFEGSKTFTFYVIRKNKNEHPTTIILIKMERQYISKSFYSQNQLLSYFNIFFVLTLNQKERRIKTVA